MLYLGDARPIGALRTEPHIKGYPVEVRHSTGAVYKNKTTGLIMVCGVKDLSAPYACYDFQLGIQLSSPVKSSFYQSPCRRVRLGALSGSCPLAGPLLQREDVDPGQGTGDPLGGRGKEERQLHSPNGHL